MHIKKDTLHHEYSEILYTHEDGHKGKGGLANIWKGWEIYGRTGKFMHCFKMIWML